MCKAIYKIWTPYYMSSIDLPLWLWLFNMFKSHSHLLSAEEAVSWKDASRSNQHLHRSAEKSPRKGVPQSRSQHQTGEGWHPGNDGQLPETADQATAADPSERLQRRLFSLLERVCPLPLASLQHWRAPASPQWPKNQLNHGLHSSNGLLQNEHSRFTAAREQEVCLETLVEILWTDNPEGRWY